MKTDPLYDRLFKELPECFVEVIGRPDQSLARSD